MSRYKKLKKKEGVEFFPFIETVFVSSEEDLWVNPFENRDIRARCFFKIIDKNTMEIFFHLTENEFKETGIGIENLPCNIYFSGDYNQINVCQMRAFGKLHLLSDISDINKFSDELREDLKKRTNDTNVSKEALKIVSESSGKFFKFIPKTYAYYVYER